MKASCPICYEDFTFTGEREPLILACCKSSSVCRACLLAHLDMGPTRCIICTTRPTRHFLQKCKDETPIDHLARLNELLIRDELAQSALHKTDTYLGDGALFAEYVDSREIAGDAEHARRLAGLIEQEANREMQDLETKDRDYARLVHEEEERSQKDLQKKLTKTAELTATRLDVPSSSIANTVSVVPKVSTTTTRGGTSSSSSSSFINKGETLRQRSLVSMWGSGVPSKSDKDISGANRTSSSTSTSTGTSSSSSSSSSSTGRGQMATNAATACNKDEKDSDDDITILSKRSRRPPDTRTSLGTGTSASARKKTSANADHSPKEVEVAFTSGDADASATWSCDSCTTVNTVLLPYCEACDTPRESSLRRTEGKSAGDLSEEAIPLNSDTEDRDMTYRAKADKFPMGERKRFLIDRENSVNHSKVPRESPRPSPSQSPSPSYSSRFESQDF